MTPRIERMGNPKPLTPRFEAFLKGSLSGTSLDAAVAPDKTRADYVCLSGLLAVEIKTLEDDASTRVANVTRELESRADWPDFCGDWPIDSVLRNLDNAGPVRRKLAERIGRSMDRDLAKADKQLGAHTAAFPRRNLVRLVAILNENHAVYD